MTLATRTSAERVGAAMSFQPPDRLPFFLHAYMHAARRLGLGIRECLENPRHVVAAERLQIDWLGHDAVSAAAPAAFELEAWGGTVEFHDAGPPEAGPPPLKIADIPRLQPPRIQDCARLVSVLQALELLKAEVGDSRPVIGSVISPFSLPVIQLGFETYLEVMLERPGEFERLVRVNEVFCVEWARAQVKAGAGMIAYADPVCSPTCIPIEMARDKAIPVTRRFIQAVGVPCAVGFASGLALPLVDDLVSAGAAGVGISAQEDLAGAVGRCRGRIGVMGNLNGLAMSTWTAAEAVAATRQAMAAGANGGLLLTDNHGEIPFPVSDDVLSAIAETVRSGARAH